MPAVRRLAAILAADVTGYSRLMGADEEGTHEQLQAHRRELIEPKISEHRGRIVKTTGDGMLVEFPSVVDAVRCAAELQRAVIDREAGIPEDRRIKFRIGINLGDIIVEDGDIFGDGVNVAARLEALSDPGGLCISRVVHDQIRDKLAYAFEDLGEQRVKNIARPVRVYALRPDEVAALPAPSAPVAAPISRPTVVPHLSIVVLPFTNLGKDPEQQYFADGITEDLTTDLSRIADMFVISRNTAFTYKGKFIDAKQVGRELGVRYLLEGSVRRSGQQIRVNAQLVDAETGAHLWAERLDRDMGDLFRLQNEITGQIARELQFELAVADAGRLTARPDVLDYILRGRAAWWKSTYGTNYAEALDLFEHALALDPRAVEAQIWLALMLISRVLDSSHGYFHHDTPNVDLQRADELVAQALAVSPNSAWAHYVQGQVLRAQSRFEDAAIEYETARTFDRNLANAYAWLGRCKLLIGSVDEVILPTEYAIRLSPRDRNLAPWYWQIGAVYLLKARTGEAVPWFEKARSAHAGLHNIHASLAAGYALKGESQRALVALKEARRLSDRYSSIARLKAAPGQLWLNAPKLYALAETTYFAGLRLAGMPDE
jgi:TolB-like protein/class 3 adenylate cyclase/tetratricopeptide (TPR) repeat protein